MSLVTITETVPNPPIQGNDGDQLILRAWYTNDFLAADGVTPVLGWNQGGPDGFFYEIECSVDDDGNLVVPAFDVQPTTESNPTAGFFGRLYVNGAPAQFIFGANNASAGWQIPTLYGASVTYAELATYNAAAQLLVFYPTYFTRDQTILTILEILLNSLSVAPVDDEDIIIVGDNDPRLPDVALSTAAQLLLSASSPESQLLAMGITATAGELNQIADLADVVTVSEEGTDVFINTPDGDTQIGDVDGAGGETLLTVDDLNGVVDVEASNGMFVNGEEVYTIPSVPNIDLTPTVQEVVDALVALGLVTQS